jgi:hypothetical protein
MPDCSVIPCHNGGTCIHTKEGPRVSVHWDSDLLSLWQETVSIITSFILHILQNLTDVYKAVTAHLLILLSGHFVKNP